MIYGGQFNESESRPSGRFCLISLCDSISSLVFESSFYVSDRGTPLWLVCPDSTEMPTSEGARERKREKSRYVPLFKAHNSLFTRGNQVLVCMRVDTELMVDLTLVWPSLGRH